MTPDQLAVVGTNSQLEPIRRAIEAAVPVQPTADLNRHQLDRVNVFDPIGNYVLPKLTSESLENPLLRIGQAEYRTLRRFSEERALPARLKDCSSAQHEALFCRVDPAPNNPVFRTTAQEYGKYQPNVHTMPYSYHGLNTRFTAKKTLQGMYRNHSLNI